MLLRAAIGGVLTAILLGGAVPAQAGAGTGTWRNGMVEGPYGPGYYGPPRAPRYADDGYYRGVSRYGEQDCYMVRRRFVDDWGRVIVRRERICE
ncbi:hypothetical protein [Microvirga puerhi]|uniref:Uncharacterized protein n=1 Tax=Microvirga puerhi TaxID=2876078 RepID=A0ABS7VHS0_9HYPH|nr:hypothetical protein [Microvirga puerhi]MBZ6074701.1 hypothetical protein [Microvirga puerhi]